MSETETNVSSSEETKTEVKTYSEEQFKGLLSDKQAEVKKRQQLESEIAGFKSAKADPPSGKIEGSTGDDAPMTVSQFRTLLAEERKTDSDAQFAALEKDSISQVKQKYTADAQGEGLDYDSVVAEGESNLSEGDRLAIRQSKNPAYEKYRRCIFNTPALSEKAEAVRTSKLLENVKLKGRVPGTGGAAGGSNETDVSSMTEEQLDKLAESID
ncbi:MAG: hypothetical protein FVQ79_11275 [Planctomycetes bacterium]|nr:hypothetical protein [Planctomycetota bacterium]